MDYDKQGRFCVVLSYRMFISQSLKLPNDLLRSELNRHTSKGGTFTSEIV